MICHSNHTNHVSPFEAIRREFERNLTRQSTTGGGHPPIPYSLMKTAEGFVLELDVPGVRQDDLSIEFDDGQLAVRGDRQKAAADVATSVVDERAYGSFQRVFKLHEMIDPETIDPVLEDGVLRLEMKTRPERQPRQIAVRPQNS